MTPREIMEKENLTCVLVGENVYKSTERGVIPLLRLLDRGTDVKGYAAADRVVGAGAAYLYAALGVTAVYAGVLSDAAKRVLLKYKIEYTYGETVPKIRNRDNTGYCPIEEAVADAHGVNDAVIKIKDKLERMKKNGN